MGMSVAVLLFVVSVSLTEAAGCIPTSSPRCYKSSTLLQEDFMCKWDKRNPKENQTHTLCIWDSEKKSFIMCANSGDQSEKFILLEELGITTRKMDIWVQTQVGNLTCNSSKISVILECLVKYSAPHITRMKRSAGKLSLKLDKPKDNKSAKYEIRWRERGSEWQNVTFETVDSTSQDSYKLRLQKQTIYQIQLRRQAKLQPHICKDSLQTLWSDWSPVVDVPLEISPSLVHKLEKKWTNGTRDINLTWDEPSAEQSVGGVKYMLNVVVCPCENTERRKKKSTSDRTYKTSITYSEARISIIATNKVGSSPPLEIVIPAVKHLSNCDKPSKITLNDQTCLEWYKLEDGETRPSTVNCSGNKTFKDIEKGVEKFVRHYYFLHTMGKKHLQTVDMCPFYSEQGAPIKGPGNVNISNVTHESAVVRWLSIPVAEQRGFLLHYLIWISGQGNATLHEVQANETSFKIKNLQPGASYTVSIAGETMAGKGPNSTVNFETHSEEMGLSWQDQTILGVCVVALLCTIICSVAVRRFRSKLIPKVPSPVIDTSEIRCPQDQGLRQTEEVHEFVLLLCQDLSISKPSENVTPEQSTLLQGFGLVVFEEEDEVDEEGEVTGLSSMKSCCYPNPSYRGQTLHLPEPFHATDSALNDNDTESTYKNGLFFETRILECDKTSL